MAQRIVIMAGGTGGHVFPALAVAQYLQAQQWEVSWIGTQRGIESRIIPAQGVEIDWLVVEGLRGKNIGSFIHNMALLVKSCWQALMIFRRRKPDVVLGMGGYVAGPGGLVASLMGIPLIIHEQNRVVGTTNKWLAEKSTTVLEAFAGSFLPSVGAICTGNPLRSSLLTFPEREVWDEVSTRDFRILVMGGSQGAKILNDVVPVALAEMEQVTVKHQTGTATFELVKKKYSKLSIKAEVVEFIDDIGSAYQWADMVICRAGAMTVSEVAAAGLPAIFVPLPSAIDDHQTANAKYLVNAGAAKLITQANFNVTTLVTAIKEVQVALAKMGQAAKNKAKPDATSVVANICMEITQQ